MARGEVGIETEVIAKYVWDLRKMGLLEAVIWSYWRTVGETMKSHSRKNSNWEELGSGNKRITSLSLNLESVL